MPLEFSSEEHKKERQKEKKNRPLEPSRVRQVKLAQKIIFLVWGLPLLAILLGVVYLGWPVTGLPRSLAFLWGLYGSILMMAASTGLEFAKPKDNRRWF